MLEEALKLIQTTAVEASGIELKAIPGDSRRMVVERPNATSLEFVDVPAPLRKHSIQSLPDFIAAVQHWGQKGIVFHSHKSVVLVVDDADRRDVVTMKLNESTTFSFLRKVGERPMDHRTMIDVLRNQLYGHVSEALLVSVRKIEVANSGRTASEINPGRERGTKEFLHELAGADNLPEYVDVNTPVYSDVGLRQSRMVRCSFEVRLPQMEFSLKPLPDELDIAVQEAQLQLHEALEAELDLPIFHGEP